jgi:adenylosuccinate lyase
MAGTGLDDRLEFIHFNLTSEDVNNIAYSDMTQQGTRRVLIPALIELDRQLLFWSSLYSGVVMPGRTHGQYAIPTTVGKEFLVFGERLCSGVEEISSTKLKGKLNGAIGNYSSFNITHPSIEWELAASKFVKSFGLDFNPITTQIEPHDSMTKLFNTIRHVNTVILGFDQDMWAYISDGYIAQKPKEGEVGSSTMPQKVNPIKFENSEANLGIANALLYHLSSKLPISRFQRDLSDSATQRWIGTAMAASLIGYNNTARGLERCVPNLLVMEKEVNDHWDMLTEPVQQILRREGVSGAYDILKGLTRGKGWSEELLQTFIASAPVSEKAKFELSQLTPHNYTGLAEKIVDEGITNIESRLCDIETVLANENYD